MRRPRAHRCDVATEGAIEGNVVLPSSFGESPLRTCGRSRWRKKRCGGACHRNEKKLYHYLLFEHFDRCRGF